MNRSELFGCLALFLLGVSCSRGRTPREIVVEPVVAEANAPAAPEDTFAGPDSLPADFRIVSPPDIGALREKVIAYMRRHDYRTDTVRQNFSLMYARGDTLHIDLKVNNSRFRNLFRKRVLDYTGIDFGPETRPVVLPEVTCPDTLGVRMETERSVYPKRTEEIDVRIVNRSGKTLFFGLPYRVARLERSGWVALPGESEWQDLGVLVKPDGTYVFSVFLYPLLRELTPGRYRIFKRIGFDGEDTGWTMSAEFRME